MKITVIAVGKVKSFPEIENLINNYMKRLAYKVEWYEVPSINLTNQDMVRNKEAQTIMNVITEKDFVALLDENGQNITSKNLADLIAQSIALYKRIVFIIGGSYGVNDTIRKRANIILAFGKQTWPHMLVRAMLAEQIYRIDCIIKNHPYHH